MVDLAGSFDLLSLTCRLMGTDVLPHEAEKYADSLNTGSEAVKDTFRFSVKIMAGELTEPLMTSKLPDELIPSLFSQLYHERLHYWQLLSYPVFQMQFFCMLEMMRLTIAKSGGFPWGMTALGAGAGLIDEAHDLYANIARQFDASRYIMDTFRTADGTAVGPVALKVFATLPTPRELVPFAGMSYSLTDGSVIRSAFDGLRLVESYVSVAQALRTDSTPLSEAKSESDLTYWSAWLAWNSMYGGKGRDPKVVMRIFLAVVDLCLLSDWTVFYDGRLPDSEDYRLQQSMLSLRFNRILNVCIPEEYFAAVPRGLPLQQLQTDISQALDWAHPFEVAFRQLEFLTRMLAGQYDIKFGLDAIQNAVGVLDDSRSTATARIGACREIWQHVAERFDDGMRVLGVRTIMTMVNALWTRIAEPEAMIAPYLSSYANMLVRYFPLPLIRLGGTYYHDVIGNRESSASVNLPFKNFRREVAHEAIALGALRPLWLGNSQDCGYIDGLSNEARCMYTSAGLGCPHRSQQLAPDEAALRRKLKIRDFCHRQLYAANMGFDRTKSYAYWRSRWGLPVD